MTRYRPYLRAAPPCRRTPRRRALRPADLTEFIGQAEARRQPCAFPVTESAKAAQSRPMDTCFSTAPRPWQNHAGPDHARAAGVNFKMTFRPRVLARQAIWSALLTNL